jgi:5'-3' exonuclease
MTAVIDLDIILFRCLFGLQRVQGNKPFRFREQVRLCEQTIERILDWLKPDQYELVLASGKNFRYKIYPEYKANRKADSRPEYIWDTQQYFIKYWEISLAHNMEADDYIAMYTKPEDIIVSTDKDFNQLGRTIYNWVTGDLFTVENPMFYFFQQMLVGDKADNIPGVLNPAKAHFKNPPNFSEQTATDVLINKTPAEMNKIVKQLYKGCYGSDWFQKYDINARLLWLRRSEGDEYHKHLE